MTAKSRYWDHERCAWVNYEPGGPSTAVAPSEVSVDSVPEQRIDDTTAAPTAPAAT
jgi:hypothetical protein